MQARQKRLDRMNTMPNIKLGELLLPISTSHTVDIETGSKSPRRCSSIEIEPGDGGSGAGGIGEGMEAAMKSLAQSCTSIAVGFHSNVISPVIEVEEETEATLEGDTRAGKAGVKASGGLKTVNIPVEVAEV